MTAQADSGKTTTTSAEAAPASASSSADATSAGPATADGGRVRAMPFGAPADNLGGRATRVYNDYQAALGQVQRDAANRQAASYLFAHPS